ncbi:MAG: hypothetical protein M3N91_02370 [Pseudomonadota bacterium]|nr:hypothetical protein [Pseudomonadota bacterium]
MITNRRIRRLSLGCLALASAFLAPAALADGAEKSFPRADTLLSAQLDDAKWIHTHPDRRRPQPGPHA